jgi:hypothetical protein
VAEHKGACCSSPAAMCYWFAASLIAWEYLASSACIGFLSMRCLPPRSFSQWQSAALPTGLVRRALGENLKHRWWRDAESRSEGQPGTVIVPRMLLRRKRRIFDVRGRQCARNSEYAN